MDVKFKDCAAEGWCMDEEVIEPEPSRICNTTAARAVMNVGSDLTMPMFCLNEFPPCDVCQISNFSPFLNRQSYEYTVDVTVNVFVDSANSKTVLDTYNTIFASQNGLSYFPNVWNDKFAPSTSKEQVFKYEHSSTIKTQVLDLKDFLINNDKN